MNRIEVLNKYYTNLDYINDKEEALDEIRDLAKTIFFHNTIDFSERFVILAKIMQDKISIFKSVCKHIDVTDTIIEYLFKFAGYIRDKSIVEMLTYEYTTIIAILLTLCTICTEEAVNLFFVQPFFTDFYDTTLYDTNAHLKLHHSKDYLLKIMQKLSTKREIIILEDSDLYAVINYLIITNFPLYKIWVQERVKEKFLWLLNKLTYSDSFTIDTFQSLKDIQFREECHKPEYVHINILSIWSEDIVAAKNLAVSLNSSIIFINADMDFSDSFVMFPYKKIFNQANREHTLVDICKKKSNLINIKHSANVIHISHIAEMNFTSIYNFFYDGTWQYPIKGKYWKNNDNLLANATEDDIIKCYESAKKGFKTWSIKSVQTRIQILSKLVPLLIHNGKFILAAVVTRWLKFPYLLFSSIDGWVSHNGNVEVMEVRKPMGVIILKEENENVLFFRLMQSLIAGNSVIVMFDANFCNFTLYCDMFLTCEIPPGVINLLSHEDTNMLGYVLCSEKYIDYINQIFLKGISRKETYIEPYKNITMSQYIIVHLK